MQLNYQIYNPNIPRHLEDAAQVSAWSEGEHMLPLTPDIINGHVLGLFAYEAASGEQPKVPVGYRAVTQDYGDGAFEVGGLIVNPARRGKGVGVRLAGELVLTAMRELAPARLIVFCNPHSIAISKALGFEEVEDVASVPAGALELCNTCPKQTLLRAGQLCCDTILSLTPSDAAAAKISAMLDVQNKAVSSS